jgi:tetratricopeptide (TPR) repeat protein
MSISDAIALALQHYQAGRSQQAEQVCRQILQQQPTQVTTLNLIGLLAAQRQQFDQAIAHYQQVLVLQPQHLEAQNNLGIALAAQGNFDQAIATYQQALALQPEVPEILVNLGNALQEIEAFDRAIAVYQQALKLRPDLAAAHKNLAHVLRMQGKLAAAMPHHKRTLALTPNDAEAHFGFAFTQLIAGDLAAGFAEYEWRWRLKYNPPRSFPQPLWDGSPLAGRTLLLYSEQGFGDTIQFIRYVPLLSTQGRVIVECQPLLLRLLQTIPNLVAITQGELLPPFDLHAPLLSLPHRMGTTLDTIPAAVPYLQSSDSQVSGDRPPLPIPAGIRFKVGIAWAGDPKNPINRRRSCPLDPFLDLLKLPGIALYSLQKGAEAAELRQINQPRLIDLSDRLQDFADTAAAVQQLDLVIAIDTAVVHLAGALAHPVWVILPFAPDWRWLLHRSDCPWYPTMRLFRQPCPGDWSAVFANIEVMLRTNLCYSVS